jgi:hypothetical protein
LAQIYQLGGESASGARDQVQAVLEQPATKSSMMVQARQEACLLRDLHGLNHS